MTINSVKKIEEKKPLLSGSTDNASSIKKGYYVQNILYVIIFTLLFSLHQCLQVLIFPDISKWTSHLISAGVVILLCTLFIFRISSLYRKISNEKEKKLRGYEKIVSTSGEHLSLIDKEYIYQLVNEPYLKAHNRDRAEIVGHTVADLLGDKIFNKEVKSRLDRTLSGEIINYQAWFDFEGAGRRYMDIFYYPVYENDGHVSAIAVNSRDITEHKESEERINTLAKFPAENPNPVFRVSADMKVLYANSSSQELLSRFGCQYSECDVNLTLPFSLKDTAGDVLNSGKSKDIEVSIDNKVYSLSIAPVSEMDCVYVYGKDITDRKKMEMRLKDSLEEKEVLLKEIHHRVKNNMQVISSLIGLQMVKVKDEGFDNFAGECQQRIKAMALVHEKLYQSENLSRVDFKDYVTTISHDMVNSYMLNNKKIRIDIDINEIFLGIETAITCGLIINELLTNTFKHAFPDRMEGRVEVAIHYVKEKEIQLIVRDNGIGLPEDIDFKKTKSLGLSLVSMMTRQLKGKIEIKSEKGAEFTIFFKNL